MEYYPRLKLVISISLLSLHFIYIECTLKPKDKQDYSTILNDKLSLVFPELSPFITSPSPPSPSPPLPPTIDTLQPTETIPDSITIEDDTMENKNDGMIVIDDDDDMTIVE